VGLVAVAAVITAPTGAPQWFLLMGVWLMMGAVTSLVLTPSARLLRSASTEDTRPAVFAAQFSLSHACFMLTYPLAGFLGAALGLASTAVMLAVIGILAAALAWWTWR